MRKSIDEGLEVATRPWVYGAWGPEDEKPPLVRLHFVYPIPSLVLTMDSAHTHVEPSLNVVVFVVQYTKCV
jgi:hypothetical protein